MTDKYSSRIEDVLTEKEKEYYQRAFKVLQKPGEDRTSTSEFDPRVRRHSGIRDKDKKDKGTFFDTYGKKGKLTKQEFFVFMRAGALYLAGKELTEANILSRNFDNNIMLRVNMEGDGQKQESMMEPKKSEKQNIHATTAVNLEILPISDSDLKTYSDEMRKVPLF